MSYFATPARDGICEIRWHGRGGQGAITSARYLAQAAFLGGLRGVTSAPSFGAERRGAPVTASTRLSPEPLRTFSQIEHPDVVVVLDETLLECADATNGLREKGWVVVNSPREPDELGIPDIYSAATADATQVCREVGVVVAGVVMFNTAMLGAVARATGLLTLDNLKTTLDMRYPPQIADKNFEAARITYEKTKLIERS